MAIMQNIFRAFEKRTAVNFSSATNNIAARLGILADGGGPLPPPVGLGGASRLPSVKKYMKSDVIMRYNLFSRMPVTWVANVFR